MAVLDIIVCIFNLHQLMDLFLCPLFFWQRLKLRLEGHYKIIPCKPRCNSQFICCWLWGLSRMISCNPNCGCHIWVTHSFTESIQTFTEHWQLPLRQSQPETPEVTRRRRGAHQTAAQSCGRRYSEERCYNQIDEQESRAHHRLM